MKKPKNIAERLAKRGSKVYSENPKRQALDKVLGLNPRLKKHKKKG